MHKKILNLKSLILNQGGFTLIELIIVIGIISILSMTVLTVLNPFGQFQKAEDARKKSDLAQIQKALESYYADKGVYPQRASSCNYSISGNNGDGNDCIEWGSSWQPYMNVVPSDPSSLRRYAYYVSPDGQAYYLYANLGRGTDPQICQPLVSGECQSISKNGISSNACGAPCNFGVSSPNVSP